MPKRQSELLPMQHQLPQMRTPQRDLSFLPRNIVPLPWLVAVVVVVDFDDYDDEEQGETEDERKSLPREEYHHHRIQLLIRLAAGSWGDRLARLDGVPVLALLALAVLVLLE